MTETIEKLEPRALWRSFQQLTQIPRPSHHETRVRRFLLDFAADRGLEALSDTVGNVIIRKQASPGYETRPAVVLQGHMDMVPQANSDSDHDFAQDPIQTRVDGDWVTASGTTLGADNGIGIAAMLAVLAQQDLQHGPLEALFTSNEEDGMDGAFGLRPGTLQGEMLINTDAEDEGVLFIGCAGGANADTRLHYQPQQLSGERCGCAIRIGGLRGGHSGVDIHRGRANAVALLFRLLAAAPVEHELCLQRVDAGNLRNAIPREASAQLALRPEHAADLERIFDSLRREISAEYQVADPALAIDFELQEWGGQGALDSVATRQLIGAVNACPNGVLRMSDAMPGMVESSNNLAIVRVGDGEIEIFNLIRSSVDSARGDICSRIAALFALIGAETRFDGHYPGWQADTGSGLLALVQGVYRETFGADASVSAIHAGLECGILGASHPGLEMISFGPTIRFPHSPDERVNIPSVVRFWQLLTGVLAKL
ncbi:MAG: aminoacyl-histidine dipeptidase [Gammaproteobacteria bacterium]|nr:aminoacyl-histidine dipeptidase [Gammaproteobacteria bacterium]